MSDDLRPTDSAIGLTIPIGSLPTHGSEKLMVVIFIVDCSKSMDLNGRIQAVNAALHELKFKLAEIKSNNNLDLRMAIMSFTSSAHWEMDLTPIDEVVLNTIATRPGLTEYGAAYTALNQKLSKDAFMNHVGKKAAPVIIFLTDGEPTDNCSFDLEKLTKNGWFTCANRSAILIGDAAYSDAAKAAVAQFVSNPSTDIVSADDTTVVTEKITAATIHTVAGDPFKDNTVTEPLPSNDPPVPTFPDLPTDIDIPPIPGLPNDIDIPPIPDLPTDIDFPPIPDLPTDIDIPGDIDIQNPYLQNDPNPNVISSPDVNNPGGLVFPSLGDDLQSDPGTLPGLDSDIDSLFPDDPSLRADSLSDSFPDGLGGADVFV